MQRPEKAPEPSMEEILASIRKIIAEEPIGSRPGPVPRSAGPESAAPGRGPNSAAGRTDPADFPSLSRADGPPFGVDDALADLMDDSPPQRIDPLPGRDAPAAPKPGARTVGGNAEENQRPSWLFARPGASAVEPPIAAGRVSGDQPPTVRGAGPAPKPLDPAALFGNDRETASPQQARAQDLPKPGPYRVPVRETTVRETGAPDQRGDAAAPSAPAAGDSRPGAGAAQPARPAEKASAPDAGVGPAPSATVALPAERPKPADLPPGGPAGDRGLGPAPAAAGAPGTDDSLRGTLVEGLAPPAAVVPSPVETQPEPQAPQAAGARSLEDAVADLLRPMLRDWLDANMPRIVEKALRVELAANAKRSDGQA